MRSVRSALEITTRPENLRRTIRIALAVGLLLSLINQGGVIWAGDAGAATWIRVMLNFCVPFLVSNLGLLAGQPGERPDPVAPGDDLTPPPRS